MADDVPAKDLHVAQSGIQMEEARMSQPLQQLGPPPSIGFKLDEKPPPYQSLPTEYNRSNQHLPVINTTGYPSPPPSNPGFPEHQIIMPQPGYPNANCQQPINGTHTTLVLAERQLEPPNQMCLSCTVLWCCCFPIGLIALGFSCMVQNRYSRGDYHGAVSAYHSARLWGNIGFFFGLCMWSLLLIWLFV